MEQPTNAQIVEMLEEQKARTAQLEERAAMVDRLAAENLELKAELKSTTQRVEAELERQRLERVSLASRVNQVEGGSTPQDKKLSRAGLFKAAAMGSAAVVGAGALGTMTAENAGATTTDTDFMATGSQTNFDARGTAFYAFDTEAGSFTVGGYIRGSSMGADLYGTGASSTGVYAHGSQYGAQLRSYGANGVPLYLTTGGSTGAPTGGTHNKGEIYVDFDGRIYHCVTTGSPGTWVPLNALIPISPVRVFDSRSASHVGNSIGPYASGVTVGVTIAGQTFATSSGTFTFPSNVVGVVGNLVAVTPTGAGYLVAYPAGATRPTAASVNFVPPGTASDIYYSLGNHVTVALASTGDLYIYMGLVTGANVQVVLDIAGYLV